MADFSARPKESVKIKTLADNALFTNESSGSDSGEEAGVQFAHPTQRKSGVKHIKELPYPQIALPPIVD
jgi:hypothetical protein